MLNTKQTLRQHGITLAFLALVIVMGILSPDFLKPGNIMNVLRQTSINGIIAVGMTLVILTGGIDLSVGSVLAFSAVVATSFAHPGDTPLMVPLGMGLLAGLGAGLANGFLIARYRIAPFIVTLGMMTIARGTAMVITGGRPVIGLSDAYNQIGGGAILGVPIAVIVFLAVLVSGLFILRFTTFGRYVYATGGNELATMISGVNTKRILISVYSITGALTGLAGVVLSSRITAASPAMGQGYELDAIAAVVIGGTKLTGGVGSILGTLMGALIIGVMNNGLDLLDVSSYWQQIVKGLIIILAVLMDRKAAQ